MLFRSCAGRVSIGAWRSRKYVLWSVCLMALIFLLYVQYTPNSMIGLVNDPQQHRTLHSFRRQRQDSYKKPPKVSFIDNDYIRHNNEREENVNELPNKLVPPQHLPGDADVARNSLMRDGFAVDKSQNVEQKYDVPQIVEKSNVARFPEPVVPNKIDRQEDIYAGQAAAEWNGGSYRYNGFGEPVYNHGNRPNYIPKQRVIHLDLKGAPPLVSMYKTLIPWLSQYGATAILMEYEDMFPWEGSLSPLAAKNHYSKEDVREFLSLCKENNLEVIPLVQTFGHLEYALKRPSYSHLREVPEMPQAICPSKNESLMLVKSMIDQMMKLHKGLVRYLHIGCDEVYQLGECEKCRAKVREALFLEHVSKVAKYVRETYKVIPIIWHDMLTHVSEYLMKDYHIGELVEPMVWVYAEDVYRFVQPSTWSKFAEVFPTAWTASAFKGAFGEQSTVPNVQRHLDNNQNWLDVMASESTKFSAGFRGLVLTGWQRHDHFAVLCELIPSALPSLAINLITVSHGYFNETVLPKLYEALKCMQTPKYQTGLNLDSDPFLWDKFSWCFFPGSLIFKSTARLDATKKEVQAYIDKVTLQRAWITDYNRRHNYSSPMRIDEDLEELPSRIHAISLLIRTVKEALSEWYDEWTVGEWIEQHIWPLLDKMETLRKEAESMKLVKTWAARPLPLLPQLEAYGVREPKNKNDARRETPEGRT
ncbi:Hexosaminidase D [Armadillidium nasatum]|uniref:beta-N-acetylhexosaminidase n=1 Tax=Armadillidium nasatum TaxID=96803 RepID=A0A5N5SS94_9CRUS|nr:Hexosaminidase D [Armadillidium nasatum]